MLQQVRRKGRQSGDTNTNEGHNTSLSTSGDRNPRLQAKQRVGEVASCDETTAAITRCAFKVYLVWGKKYRFALTSSTIMGKKVGWSKKTVGFKPTAFEPLALQARVVQFATFI